MLASRRPEFSSSGRSRPTDLIQFFKAYNYRSDRRSVWHRPFANRWRSQSDR